ncbi:hypothetical protein Pcaca05_02370 [Pectobacterium carotovorum subsp. carotovorum]|nr:hypothetical protein Pcaca05_02370 [Pectobacterium carotovorum subsp. carotovorum]
MCVGFSYSLQSLTYVSSWGFMRLPRYETHNEPRPRGPMLCIVQNVNVLSCNSNYLGYMAWVLMQFNNSGFNGEEKGMDEKM